MPMEIMKVTGTKADKITGITYRARQKVKGGNYGSEFYQ